LNFKNVRTKRLLKKFDFKTAKYEIIKVISFYNYKLNILLRIYNVFYSRLLRPVTTDLLLF
ncbi:hypothetical protein DL98DRAFT_443064, partial [Cadophora sp. DSE1049]